MSEQSDDWLEDDSQSASAEEAARLGGEAVLEEYGPGFYKHIGRKGGEAVKEKYGEDYFSKIGKKGGEAVLQKYGTNFYGKIAQQDDNVSDTQVDEQKSMHQLYEELKGIVEQFNELVNTSE